MDMNILTCRPVGRAQFFVDLVLELALLARDETSVAFRIDPRLHAFGLRPLSLAFEVVVFVVLREPDIGLQHFEKMVRAPVVVRDAGVEGSFASR